MSTANLGRVGFVNKGTWSDGVHKINDLVTYGTAKYACIVSHTSVLGNIIPTNISYWEKWTDYGIHSVSDITSAVSSTADVVYTNYFSGTKTGVMSVKITGLVTATASTVDLGYMEVTIIQDDRDHSSVTNPSSYKFMIKGNMDIGVWYNTQAVLIGTSSTVPINIRFTRTATDAYIEIGDTTSTWINSTIDIAHITSYIITGYTPFFLATIQASLLGTTTDSIISTIPNSTKNENTIQANVASATTCSIGTYLAGDTLYITGTTTINSFGVSTTGTIRNIIFNGVIILNYNATSMILPTSSNITTAIGDTAMFICTDGPNGYWTCLDYQRKDGSPVSLTSLALVNPTANNITYKATPVSITAWSYTGTTTTTITLTVASHTFVVNDFISVTGLTTSTAVSTANNYIIPNGVYQVTAITSTTIQYTITTPSALTLTPTVSSATVIGQTVVNGIIGGFGSSGQQTYNLATSRASGVIYQNTSGKPITVYIVHSHFDGTSDFVSVDGTNFITVGTASSATNINSTYIVPNNWYYKSSNIINWAELR